MARLESVRFFRIPEAYCPHCGGDSSVIESTKRRGSCTVRQHRCCKCGRRFRSVESGRRPAVA